MSPIHYLPLTLGFFAILVGLFLLLVAMIQVGILRYAYMRLKDSTHRWPRSAEPALSTPSF